ncbi:hypothetical protein N657DRAFT_631221 [Parathielavia appendiculata]|uniref:Uncharacterized protein n=1 Tax=Parathielavia appendiculata TaxID=2587402 RepID=A0AAN6U6K5_9PEZI|nr:hypothetical protein N657DRAFT_631221 [Parathielavia appendiculata]
MYQRAAVDIPRQHRFEMATHVASVLLQAHTSPFPATRHAGVVPDNDTSSNDDNRFLSCGNSSPNEEHTRACLFTVEVMVLELILGHNIEDCQFRKEYYGSDNLPNDQTDIYTARRWAKKVLGESGANVSDAVRRCRDCSFGPRPNFSDVRFREPVYEGVMKPLADYLKTWPEVMP